MTLEAQLSDLATVTEVDNLSTEGGVVATGPTEPGPSRGWMHRLWDAATAAIGVLLGLAPHVLHHIALLGGTVLVAGSGGTALFGVLGLVASVPLLLRLRRRFGSWWAPAIGLGAFAVLFALSAFVIGPAISGVNDVGNSSVPAVDHGNH